VLRTMPVARSLSLHVVLQLSLFGVGGAMRQQRALALPSRRWQMPLTAAALLVATAPAHASDNDSERVFAAHDRDHDGFLTEREFLSIAPLATLPKQHELRSIFIQADVDDDKVLSPSEFHFAGYLITDQAAEEKLREIEGRLPHNFRDEFAYAFNSAREASVHGHVGFEGVKVLAGYLLGVSKGEFSDGSEHHQKLRRMFDQADITEDGYLNLNELDYFHYILRDVVLEATLRAHAQERSEDMLVVWNRFAVDLDIDFDFTVSEAELTRGLQQLGAATPAAQAAVRRRVGELFVRADADGDGALGGAEWAKMYTLLMGWQAD